MTVRTAFITDFRAVEIVPPIINPEEAKQRCLEHVQHDMSAVDIARVVVNPILDIYVLDDGSVWVGAYARAMVFDALHEKSQCLR